MKKVFLDELPKWESGKNKGCINWKESIGYKIHFIYDDIEDEVEIIGCESQDIIIKYKNKTKHIKAYNFSKCKIGELFKESMWITHRELCEQLGIPKEVAKSTTYGSHKPITINCKCGNVVKVSPCNVVKNKSIGCKKCGDGISYPNKIIYSSLEQSYEFFETEYSPEYLKGKRNDFYLPSYKIVIEADGGLGHKDGRIHSKSTKTLDESIEVDKWKEEQNLKHGVKTIRINCFMSELDYIKNNILNSELTDYIDFSNVNWNKCEEFALKSMIYETCNYWYEHREVNKEDITTNDLASIFKLSKTTIRNYLKKGNNLGWCNYNANEEKRRNGIKNGKNNGNIILIYTLNNKYISTGESITWIEQHSVEKFGTYLDAHIISDVCKGKRSSYKGFIFKYAKYIDK